MPDEERASRDNERVTRLRAELLDDLSRLRQEVVEFFREAISGDRVRIEHPAASPERRLWQRGDPRFALEEAGGRLAARIDDVTALVEELPREDHTRAWRATAAMNDLRPEAAHQRAMFRRWMATTTTSIATSVTNVAAAAANWITSHLLPRIKAISAHLWNLISGLLTLKGWEVKGSVGGPLFGLAGVEVTLKFEN